MFRKLLFRNLIFMIIPALIIEASLVFICLQLRSMDENSTYELESLDDVVMYYKLGKRNISFRLDGELVYSGFDMKSDGAVTGHYYYLANDNKMYLFVLNDVATKLINKGNLVRIKATLVEDEAASGFIEKEYTDAMNLGEEALDGYIESVIISQPDYPERRIVLINYTMAVAYILVAITLIYFIASAIFPELNMLFKLRGLASSRRKLIKKLDKEMKDKLESVEGSVYTTEKYIINAKISYIDIKKR